MVGSVDGTLRKNDEVSKLGIKVGVWMLGDEDSDNRLE